MKGMLHTHYNYHRGPNFTPFCHTAICFRVPGHFETSAPNDSKMTFNTKRSNGTCIHMLQVTRIPHVAPQPAVFELQALWKQVHHYDHKMTLNNKRSKVPPKAHIHVTSMPESHSISLYSEPIIFQLPF